MNNINLNDFVTNIEELYCDKNITTDINLSKLKPIKIEETGKGYTNKICNIYHILKHEDFFQKNQTDKKGNTTRRPSCNECKENIDGKKILSSEKSRMKKNKT